MYSCFPPISVQHVSTSRRGLHPRKLDLETPDCGPPSRNISTSECGASSTSDIVLSENCSYSKEGMQFLYL